ncbi:MAG TPA: serine hydrolase domain-containing protein [Rhizomicrobium sp.]|jgi:CubicO group peptidase (beta-lactamase class C family)
MTNSDTMHRRHFLALTGAAAMASPALAKSQRTDWQREFGDYVSGQLTATNTPGVGVAMVRGGRTVFSAGYGYADVEKARRVTPDTVFQIASVSKTVTATALMMLWDDGAFKLDAPIAPLLDFAVVNPNFPKVPVTFRQLFTHTSSISDGVYDGLDFSTGDLPSLHDFLAGYLFPGGKWYDASKCFSDTRPGGAWSYSNVAVALLGYLGERLSGKPLDEFTRERIFTPLGMHDTSWRYEGVSDDRLAQPYDFADVHFKRLPRARYPDWPAGLLCTSANDFARFLSIYTQGGTANGHAFLKPETIGAMFTPAPVAVNSKSPGLQQGLIWELAPMGDATIALHPGGDPGSATLAAVDTAHGTAALCFANITPNKSKLPFEKEIIRRLIERGNA